METTKVAYRPSELSRSLGIGRTKIYELLDSGAIKSVKVGGARLIPASEVDAFLQRKLEEAAG